MQHRLTSKPVELVNIATALKAAFTSAFATSILTSIAHGLRNGDVIRLSNSGGALPDGLSATTNYYVKVIDVNTFLPYLDSEFKTLATFVDDGTGTHSFSLKCRKINVKDFKNVILSVNTASNANFTMKVQISAADSCPDFYSAASASNPWSYAQIKDLDDMTAINGSTGTGPSGTDINKTYEVNTNSQDWLCIDFTSVTAGKVQIVLSAYGDI